MNEGFINRFPLGIRANNPCAIERQNYVWWLGEATLPIGGKCAFTNWVYGVRAAVITLRTYMEKDGVRTVYGVIARWSGLGIYDLEAYLSSVLSGMHGASGASVVTEDMLPDLVCAIARYECGFPVLTPELVARVVKLIG